MGVYGCAGPAIFARPIGRFGRTSNDREAGRNELQADGPRHPRATFGQNSELARISGASSKLASTIGLRCAFERDDREVRLAIMEIDFECEPIARLSGDERTRSGAGRAARSPFAGFDAGSSIGRSQPEIDFIRRQALERRMGTMPVVVATENVIRGVWAGMSRVVPVEWAITPRGFPSRRPLNLYSTGRKEGGESSMSGRYPGSRRRQTP